MINENTYLFINDHYTYHGEGRINSNAIGAAMRIDWRMTRSPTIKSVHVGKRKVELTFNQRYALYKERMTQMQADVHRIAAENPEDVLLNSYTHIAIMSEQFVTHAFLDSLGCPRNKGEEWQSTAIDNLCKKWLDTLDAPN